MSKHSLSRRVQGILRDIGKEDFDPQARWKGLIKDFQKDGRVEELEFLYDAIGAMPEATLDDIDQDKALYYSARDADATLRIDPHLDARIDAMGLRECYEMDLAVVPMVERMQSNGLPANKDYFVKLGEEFTPMMAGKVEDIFKATGKRINPGSGDQVAELLFKTLRLPSKKLTKGGARGSTDDKVLEGLRATHPVPGLICDYRELAKLRDTYCVALPRYISSDGRIRPNLRITRVSSGRLSSSDPNLLGIPTRTTLGKRIRTGFVAPPGCVLGSWDLDQIEMRVAAHESADPVMCDLFSRGVDIHRATAGMIWGVKPEEVTTAQRTSAKNVGFGVLFGISEKGLLVQMHARGQNWWTEDMCREVIKDWFKIYKGVASAVEGAKAETRRHGYVRDMWGRIRYLPGVHSDIPSIRAEAERQAFNHKIQAGAQGIIKRAMAEIWEWLRHYWRKYTHRVEPLLQIHDELMKEVAAREDTMQMVNEAVIKRLTTTTILRVPVKAKGAYAKDWGSLKD